MIRAEITLIAVLAPVWVLNHLSPVRAEDNTRNGGGGYDCRPIYQDYITHLGEQYLNDGLSVPAAFNEHSGTLTSDGQAAFRVYALTDDIRYYQDVTYWSKSHGSCRRLVGVRVRPAPGSGSVRGKWKYRSNNGVPEIVFTPRRKEKVARTAIITFTFTTTKPREEFSSNFALEIPAGVGSSAAGG